MNKIFKVIWSKSKQCYIVVSEIAKNKTGKKKTVVAAVFAALALVGGGQDALGAVSGAGSGNSFSNAQSGVSFINGQGLAIGSSATVADGNTNTVAVGISSVARGSSSVAIGGGRTGTNASYRTKGGQIAIGWAEVNGEGAVGIGGSSNTTVTGDGSVGIGGLNSVNGSNSIGMASSNVNGDSSVALASARATGSNSFAASGGIANGDRSLAIGQGADTKGGAPTSNPGGTDNIALGTNAITNATNYNSNNIAIGSNTKANGGDSVAIGRDTVAASWRAYASGINAYAGSQAGVAIGAEAKDNYATHGGNSEVTITNSYAGVAIGARTITEGTGSTAVGFNAQATKRGAVAIGGADDVNAGTNIPNGTAAQATAERAIAIGTNAQSLGAASIAMGYNSSITSGTQNSIALGTATSVSAGNAVAIGNMATASIDSGVAIGRSSSATQGPGAGWGGNSNNRYSGLANGALTSQFGGVSIGKVDNGYQWTRKLHGLAAGSADTDAVNVAQLKNTQLVVTGNTGTYGLRVFDQGLGIKSANTNVLTTSMSTDGTSTLTITPVMGTVTNNNNNLVTGGQVYQAIQDNKVKYFSIGGANYNVATSFNTNNDGATTQNAIAIGPGARATGASALSLGAGAQSKSSGTIAIGGYNDAINAQANGTYAVSVGANSIAGGSGAIAIGSGSGSNWNAQGGGAKAAGDNTVAIGGSSNATQAGGIAIGSSATGDPTKGPQSTGRNAIAIGESAAASGASSLAILSSNASGKNAIAIGNGAQATADSALSILGNATGVNSTSVGTSSYATGLNASALGGNARATKDNSTALGINGYATAVGATAINGQATGEYSQSYGISSQAGGKGAIAIGSASDGNLANGPQAFGDTSIAIGALAKATKVNSIAFLESKANGVNSIAFGAQTTADAENAVAIGYNGSATSRDAFAVFGTASNTNAIAIGRNAQALSDSTTAIGSGSLARGNGSVGIGGGQAQTAGTVSIGPSSSATTVNSIALGSNSVANRDGNVAGYRPNTTVASSKDYTPQTGHGGAFTSAYGALSIGTAANTRQITGVAAGSQDTDAVNVAQLKSVSLGLKGDGNTSGATRLSDEYLTIKGAAGSGITTSVSGNTVNVGLDTSQLAWKLQVGTGAATNIAGGDTVTVRAGKNMQLSRSGNTITVATSDTPTFTNVNATNLLATGIVRGATGIFPNLTASTITLNGTLTAGDVSVSSNGINAGGKAISGVGEGQQPSDAVNKSQLDIVNTTATNAMANAQTAQQQAATAVNAAAAANTAATNAQNTANAANTTAGNAQTTANAANATANRAETAVNTLTNTVSDMRFNVNTGSDGGSTQLTTANNANHPTLSLAGEAGYLDVKTGTNGTNEAVVNLSLAQATKDKINAVGNTIALAGNNGSVTPQSLANGNVTFAITGTDGISTTASGGGISIGLDPDAIGTKVKSGIVDDAGNESRYFLDNGFEINGDGIIKTEVEDIQTANDGMTRVKLSIDQTALDNAAKNAGKFKVQANSDGGADVVGGDTVSFNNGDNIQIDRNGRDFTIKTAKNVNFDSATIGANTTINASGILTNGIITDSITAGTTTIDGNGYSDGTTTIDNGGLSTSNVTVGPVIIDATTGIDAGNKVISGVASGAGADTNAANIGDVKNIVNNSLANVSGTLNLTDGANTGAVDLKTQTLTVNGTGAATATVNGQTLTVDVAEGSLTTAGGTVTGTAGVAKAPEVATAINDAVTAAKNGLQTQITQNTTDIGTNKADIATNKADIATNKAAITKNTGDIATLNTTVANNNNAVNNRIDGITLNTSGNSGTGSVNLKNDTLSIVGTNGITTSANGSGLTISLDASNQGKINAISNTIGITGNTGSVTAKSLTDGSINFKVVGDNDLVSTSATGDTVTITSTTKLNDAVTAATNAANKDLGNLSAAGEAKIKSLAGDASKFTVKANTDAGEEISGGDVIDFKNGDNIAITRTGGNFTIATKKDVTFDSATIGGTTTINNTGITTNSVTAGNTTIDNNGLTNGTTSVTGNGVTADKFTSGNIDITNNIISGLSDATADDEAVNKGQLDRAVNTLGTNTFTLKADTNDTAPQVLNRANGLSFKIAGDGDLISTTAVGNTVSVTASQALKDAVNNANNAANKDLGNLSAVGEAKIKSLAGDASKFTVKANTDAGEEITGGDVIDFKDGDNIAITRTGSDFTIGTKANVTFTSVTTGDSVIDNAGFRNGTTNITGTGVTADTATIGGNTTINNAGVTTNAATIGGTVTIDNTGIDVGNKTISNVANATTADQAINKGQLDTAITNLTNNIGTATNISYKANNGTAETTTLANGLDFTNGTLTTTEVAPNGVVKVNVTQGALTTTGGTVTGTAGVATAPEVATAINSAVTDAKNGLQTQITKNTGDIATLNTTVANNNTAVNNRIDGITLNTSGNNGTGSVNLKNDTLAITGTNGVTTTATGSGITIALDATNQGKINAISNTIGITGNTGSVTAKSLTDGSINFKVVGDNDLLSTSATGDTVTITSTTKLNDAVTAATNAANKDLGNLSAAGEAKIKSLAGDASKFKVKANGDAGDDVSGGDAVNFIDGTNIEITRNGKDFTIGTKANATFTSVTTGNSVMDNAGFRNGTTNITGSGVTADSANIGGKVTINNAGINAGNTAITNVASGGNTRTNAANVGDVQDAVANLSQNLTVTDGTTDGVVDLKNQKLTIAGTGAATSTVAGQTVTINVAEGTLSTDAAGQVSGTTGVAKAGDVATVINQAITKATGDVNLNTSGDTGTGSVNLKTGTLAVTGDTLVSTAATGSGISVTATQALKDAVNNANNAANKDLGNLSQAGEAKIKSLAGDASKFKVKANGDAGDDVSGGDAVNFIDGTNIEITRNGKDFTIGTKANATFTSVTTGNSVMDNAGFRNGTTNITGTGVTADTATIGGNTTINNAGVTTNAATIGGTVTIDNNGIDAGNKNISNVANATTADQAINKGQFDTAINALTGDTTKLGTNTLTLKADATDTMAQALNKTGGLAFKVAGDNTLIKTTAAGDTITVAATQSLTDAVDKANNAANKDLNNLSNDGKKVITDLAGNASKFTVKANTDAGEEITGGDVIDFKDGDNIAITRTGSDFTIATKKDVTFDSATIGGNTTINKTGITTNKVVAGNTTIDNNGLTNGTTSVTGTGVTADKFTAGNVVVNGATNKISGLSDATAADEAINKGQLDTAINNINSNANKLASNTFTLKADATDTTAQRLDNNGGLAFKVAGDGDLISTTAAGDTVTVSLTKGSLTNNADGTVNAATAGAATTGDVATVINQAINKATGDQSLKIGGDTAATGSVNLKNDTLSVKGDNKFISTAANGNDITLTVNEQAIKDAAKSASTFKVKANATNEEEVKGGDIITFNDGDNIAITQTGKTFTIGTKADVNFTSVTTGNSVMDTNGFRNGTTNITGTGVTADTFKAGNTTINTTGLTNGNTAITSAGVTADSANIGGKVSINNAGIDAGNTVITNVASGGTTRTNAANVGDVQDAVANLSQNLTVTDGTTDGVVDLKNQKLTIAGTGAATSTVAGQTVTINVAEGTLSTDAAGQVNGTTGVAKAGDVATVINQAITKATGDVNLNTSGDTGTGSVNLKTGTLAVTGDTLVSTAATGSGISVTATQALKNAVDKANNAATKDLDNISTAGQTVIKDLAGDASKFKVKANTDAGEDVVGGSVIDFKNGDNIEITRTGLDFKIATAKNVTFDSATIGGNTTINNNGITTNKVVAGNTSLDNSGVTADKFTAGNVVVNGNTNKISGLADATANDEAINKGQFDNAINDINNKANTLGQNTIKLGAENNTATGTQQLNKTGGLQFNVVGDNDLVTTSAAGDTVTVSLTKGSLTNNADGTVNAATAGAATTGDVANVVNTAITKATGEVNLKTSGNTGTGSVNLKNDTFAITGDNTLIATTANATGLTVNATKALQDAVDNANNAANKDLSNITPAGQNVIKNLASDAATFKVKANGDAGEDVKGGDAIDFINGDNIEITRNGRNFTIGTAANVTFNSATIGGNTTINNNGITTNKVVAGNTSLDNSGVTADKFTAGNVVVNGNTNKISGLADATANDEAINKGQFDNAINDINNKANTLGQNTIKLGAENNTATGTQQLNKAGGLQFNVVGDNDLITTSAAGDTVTVSLTKGSLTNNADGTVNAATAGAATTGDVATVINQAINKATGDQSLKIGGDTAATGSVNLKNDTLSVKGDNKFISTAANGNDITLTVDEQAIKDAAKSASTFKVKANGDAGEDVKGGDAIDFINGDNIEITRNGRNFTIGTAANVTFNSATIGGNTTINNNGITTNKVVAGNTTVDTNGLVNGNTSVKGDGISTDKVTVGPVVIDKTGGIDAGNTVISNIANGTTAKDAINKGQLDDAIDTINNNANKLASNTFTLKADSTDTTAQRLDNNGGLAFKVAGDGDLISTTAAGDTVTVNLAKGTLTNNADGTANATKAGVATTGDVANVVNNAITKATDNVVLNTEGNTGTGSVNLKSQVLKVEGTGGITVTAAAQGLTLALDPTSSKNVKAVENTISIGGDTGNVTAKSLVDGNIEFNIKGDGNVIKTTGSGQDVTINFDATEAAKSVNLTFRENGGTAQTRSLNDGFNFKNGNLTTASAAANGDITFNVVEGTVTVDNTGKATAGTTPGVATAKTVADTVNAATKALADSTKTITDGLANRDLNNLTTAGETKVKDLAAFNVTATGAGTGHGNETIKGGNTVTFNAGQNIVIDQAGSTFTVKTSDDVAFNKATIGGNTTIDNTGVNTNKATIGGNTTIDNAGVNTNQVIAGNSKMDNTGFTNGNTSVTGAGVTTDRVTVGPVTIDKNSGIDAGNTKITGVAAGTANTDAVNVGQLNKTVDDKIDANNTVIDNKIANATDTKNIRLNYSANGGADESVSLADGLDFKNGNLTTTEVAPGGSVKVNVVEGKIDLDNKGKATATTPGVATAGDVAKAINDLNQNVKDARIRFNADNSVANDSTTSIDTGLNQTIEFIGGADKSKLSDGNIGVNVVGNKMEIKLAKEVTGLTSTSYTDGAANPNTTVVNAGGITIQAAPFTPTGSTTPVTPPPVSLTATGLDNGGNTITNVAPGQNDTDAVNVAQLKAFGGDTQSALARLGRENQRVGAQAAAMAALKPLQYDPLEPTQIMAGVGNYRGETAGALGVAHYTNEDTMFHIGATIGNDNNMINAGVTHKFGSSAEKKYIPDRYKAGPISSVYVMQTEVSNLQQENAQQKHVISDQQARLDAMESENARQKQQLDAQQKSIEELKAAVDALLARG